MKWVIFTGTWRLVNKEVENDVRQAARRVFENGDGLVTGGLQALIILPWMNF